MAADVAYGCGGVSGGVSDVVGGAVSRHIWNAGKLLVMGMVCGSCIVRSGVQACRCECGIYVLILIKQ